MPARTATARCDRSPGEVFGGDLTRIAYVTPGGTTRLQRPARAACPPPRRSARAWSCRRGGETRGRAACAAPSGRRPTPPFAFTTQLSGDGHFLEIVPDGLPAPGHRLRAARRGRLAPATARARGRCDDTIRFRTAPVLRRGPPLRDRARRVSAFELSRLAVPLPPILPSLNQIGFDSYDMVVGALAVAKPDAHGRRLAAALGGGHEARPRRRAGGRPRAARSPSRSPAATATTR